jgi:vrille protein
MVAGEFGDYGRSEGEEISRSRSASQGEDMMLESKYFPGHPGLNPVPTLYPSPTFGRKDIFSQRKQREFIPEAKKDDSYWDRRRRNNEAAKRSREKRRLNDMILENRVLELSKDNHILQSQLNAIYEKYGIKGENLICMDQVLSTLPTNDQVLNFTKKRMGSLASLSPRAMSPFQSLSLPIKMSSSSMNNNTTSYNNNNDHDHDQLRHSSPPPQSPESYRPSSPPSSSYPVRPSLHQNFTDIRAYAETGHMYSRVFSAPRFDEGPNDDKDSGLALNLSTDRAGSDGRSSGTGSPSAVHQAAGCPEREGSSSGDESGYPRSPNSGESCLPHKLRFKSVATEKEAVSSLLSLHQIAMIKREPSEVIHSWMDKLPSTPVFPGLIPAEKHDHHHHQHHQELDQHQPEEEPAHKRSRTAGPPEQLTDEVARLTDEVATLKNILVNRMKEEWVGGADRSTSE